MHDDPRAKLDAQVLARHEDGVTPHGHSPVRIAACRSDRCAARRHPTSRTTTTRPPTRDTTRSARGHDSSGSCDARSTVAPSATTSATISPSTALAPASSPAWGSSRSHSSGRRVTSKRERHPPALAGRQSTHRGPPHPAPELQAIEHGVDVRHAGASGSDREAHVLDDGQVVVEGGGMSEHAHPPTERRPHPGGGRIPSTVPSPPVSGSKPAHTRSTLVLPAPFGPSRTTTSPWATARSTPARAGNRPVTQTAVLRRTAGAMAWRPCYGGPPL